MGHYLIEVFIGPKTEGCPTIWRVGSQPQGAVSLLAIFPLWRSEPQAWCSRCQAACQRGELEGSKATPTGPLWASIVDTPGSLSYQTSRLGPQDLRKVNISWISQECPDSNIPSPVSSSRIWKLSTFRPRQVTDLLEWWDLVCSTRRPSVSI